MASHTSLEGLSSPIDIPTTPQPHEDLQTSNDMKRLTSPSNSIVPDAKSISVTPPPSSQMPRQVEAATPDASILSSPPLTVVNGAKKDVAVVPGLPTSDQIQNASTEELRDILDGVLAANTKLELAAREARMSAAHFKLQHNLLIIDSEEAIKRLEVEHDMTRREVQALQNTGRDNESYSYIAKLKTYCKELEEEGNITRRRLHKAKQLIEDKDFKLIEAREENERLRDRIRQNREHINMLRSPGGPLHLGSPKTSPITPQHYRTTPKHTPGSLRRREPPGSARPFEALLLADAVLSQEHNSAPSTPIISRHPGPRTPNRHTRNVQSVSSLQAITGSARRVGHSGLLPSAQFSPEAEARSVGSHSWNPVRDSRERRRKSRDSTISAEDNEPIQAGGRSFREESEEVYESQASQSATEMLRVDPRESFEVAASRTTTPNPGDKPYQQSKIYGGVTKSVAEKRKRSDDDMHATAKKLRAAAGAAIGLGIGMGSGH